MKTTITIGAASAFIGLANAIVISDYAPECALDCLTDAISSGTECSIDDGECQCIQENYEAIYIVGADCVIDACGSEAAVQEVLPAVGQFCTDVLAGEGDDTAETTTTTEEAAAEETTSEAVADETTGATPAETTTEADDTEADATETGVEATSTFETVSGAAGAAPRAVGGVAAVIIAGLAAL
ncbi:hypothetical protein MKZ38_000016 [Zalerion maritima]|uniref:CFEM domain-containing protein n=1 Tax=Zalerion maritima TaxID=339359 RepID=A0AAD5RFA5_9PEZI|nr:hypothetical protein MKZ38_000016 [Zalerion maritima]